MHITPVGLIILLLFIGIPIGIFILNRWRKTGSFSFRFTRSKGKEPDNTMLFDAKRGIYFERADHADLIPMTCRNNGLDYYVIKDSEQLEVPDSCEYYDPGEYGNVLTMRAHADLFERRRTLLQNIAPWALVVGMIVVGIFLVMVLD